MRRRTLTFSIVAALVLLTAGVALAATVNCTGGTCEGTSEDDEITGSNDHDLILARDGGDEAFAKDGDDEVRAGDGADTAEGGLGDDTLLGGHGKDFLPEDFEDPDDGRDEIRADGGADCMGGGPRGDEIHGEGGDERETRECGEIGIFGDQGSDKIFGGDGNDGIEGEEGDDEIHGGHAGDFIDAADDESPNGKDTVDCGGGEDEAVVNANDDVDNCETVTLEISKVDDNGSDQDKLTDNDDFDVAPDWQPK